MTTNLWAVIIGALIAVAGTIYTAIVSLKTNQNTLKQSLEIKMREIAAENVQEAEDARQDERGSNLAEAKSLREELKVSREEIRADRDRIALMLAASEKKSFEVEEFARLERGEFRVEISMLQAKQREIDSERAMHKTLIDTLKKQHCAEIAKYKKQLVTLTSTVARMEARIKELEAGKSPTVTP